MKKYFASSELIINDDGSVFHLHVKPEWLADKVILVGDPGRVALVGSHLRIKNVKWKAASSKPLQVLTRANASRWFLRVLVATTSIL